MGESESSLRPARCIEPPECSNTLWFLLLDACRPSPHHFRERGEIMGFHEGGVVGFLAWCSDARPKKMETTLVKHNQKLVFKCGFRFWGGAP